MEPLSCYAIPELRRGKQSFRFPRPQQRPRPAPSKGWGPFPLHDTRQGAMGTGPRPRIHGNMQILVTFKWIATYLDGCVRKRTETYLLKGGAKADAWRRPWGRLSTLSTSPAWRMTASEAGQKGMRSAYTDAERTLDALQTADIVVQDFCFYLIMLRQHLSASNSSIASPSISMVDLPLSVSSINFRVFSILQTHNYSRRERRQNGYH